jgi:hypothetical protein
MYIHPIGYGDRRKNRSKSGKQKEKEKEEDSCSLVMMRYAPPETRVKANCDHQTDSKGNKVEKQKHAMQCYAGHHRSMLLPQKKNRRQSV